MPLPPAISSFKLKLIQHRVLQIVVRDGSGRTGNFTWGGGGCRGLPSEGNKEYEIRTKMEEEQRLQLKMLFLLGYNVKIVIWCKCVCVCVCVCVWACRGGESLLVEGGAIFWVVVGGLPPYPRLQRKLSNTRDKIRSQNPTNLQ